MKNILLLEDDITLAETLVELLESESFNVTWVKDGEAALETIYKNNFDFYLFDVNVPLLSGFELLKSLREYGNKTPTIFLTALSDIDSLSEGFEVGVDDYIKKPFEFDELIVRINALLRKRFNSSKNIINVDDFSFNIELNELNKAGSPLSLSLYEVKLCQLFFMNRGHTITKDNLLDAISSGSEVSDGTLRVYINKLRKIGLNLENIKGIGYRFG
jgi:DNA-binding response OmpR family regulator